MPVAFIEYGVSPGATSTTCVITVLSAESPRSEASASVFSRGMNADITNHLNLNYSLKNKK